MEGKVWTFLLYFLIYQKNYSFKIELKILKYIKKKRAKNENKNALLFNQSFITLPDIIGAGC